MPGEGGEPYAEDAEERGGEEDGWGEDDGTTGQRPVAHFMGRRPMLLEESRRRRVQDLRAFSWWRSLAVPAWTRVS